MENEKFEKLEEKIDEIAKSQLKTSLLLSDLMNSQEQLRGYLENNDKTRQKGIIERVGMIEEFLVEQKGLADRVSILEKESQKRDKMTAQKAFTVLGIISFILGAFWKVMEWRFVAK
jgi:hypothetical protein